MFGGYQVKKKGLSYRKRALLGRALMVEEVREVTIWRDGFRRSYCSRKHWMRITERQKPSPCSRCFHLSTRSASYDVNQCPLTLTIRRLPNPARRSTSATVTVSRLTRCGLPDEGRSLIRSLDSSRELQRES